MERQMHQPMLDQCKDILTRLDKRLEQVQEGLHEIRTLYESHAKRIERIEHEVFGNGRTGLAVQVRAILWIASGCLGFLVVLAAEMLGKLF